MNRGFKYYYKEGIKSSVKSLKNRENYLKYLLFLFGKMIATLFVLPLFMFKLSGVKLHKTIKANGRVAIINSFKESNCPKNIWNIILATIIKLLIISSGVLLIGAVGGILALFGYLIGGVVFEEEMFMICCAIPAIAALVIYLVIYPLYYSPVDYLVQTDNTIGASDAVSLSVNSMKLTGKMTVFITNLVSYLIIGTYLSIIVGLAVLYSSLFDDAGKVIIAILLLILALGSFIIIPLFTMAKNITLVSLYEDMVLDRINLNKNVEGIKIRRFDVKAENIENELVKMFDETEDEEAVINVLKADFTVRKKKTQNKFKKIDDEKVSESVVTSELTKVVDEIVNEDIDKKPIEDVNASKEDIEEVEEIYVDSKNEEINVEEANNVTEKVEEINVEEDMNATEDVEEINVEENLEVSEEVDSTINVEETNNVTDDVEEINVEEDIDASEAVAVEEETIQLDDDLTIIEEQDASNETEIYEEEALSENQDSIEQEAVNEPSEDVLEDEEDIEYPTFD